MRKYSERSQWHGPPARDFCFLFLVARTRIHSGESPCHYALVAAVPR
jgi:hypothetical protein